MLSFKWRHFEKEIILLNVRWYLAYPLSYRNLEEIAEERGYHVDHSTLNRGVITYAPKLEKEFHKKKRPVGGRQWHSLKPLPHLVKSPHECNRMRNHFTHFNSTLGRRFTPPPFVHRLFGFPNIGSTRSELLMIS